MITDSNEISLYDSLRSLKILPEQLPAIYEPSKELVQLQASNQNVLDGIIDKNLISQNDIELLEKNKEFLVSTYTDVPAYNTKLSKINSILSEKRFETPDAKYWQCKMQAEVHYNEFIRNMYKVERVKIDIEEITFQIQTLDMILKDKEKDLEYVKLTFDQRRLKNKLQQYIFESKQLEKDCKQRLREIGDWIDIANNISKDCKHDRSNYETHVTKPFIDKLNYQLEHNLPKLDMYDQIRVKREITNTLELLK
jgi:hypothetical protein